MSKSSTPLVTAFFQDKNKEAELRTLLSLDADSVVRKAELGSHLSLEDAPPLIRTIQDLLKLVSDTDPKVWPPQLNQKLMEAMSEATRVIKRAQNFKPEGNDPRTQRAQIVDGLREAAGGLSMAVGPFVAMLTTSQTRVAIAAMTSKLDALEVDSVGRLDGEVASIKYQLSQLHRAGGEQVAEQINRINDLATQAERALEAAQMAAGRRAISVHATAFTNAAARHETAAKRWLTTTAAVFLLTFGLVVGAVWFHATHPPGEATSINLQLAIAQLSMLSLCFFAVVFAGQTYRANRHLQTLNEHRATALSTFDAFAEATGSPDTKNVVLTQTTSAIFSHQPTGFLGHEAEGPMTPISIMEIVRSGKD